MASDEVPPPFVKRPNRLGRFVRPAKGMLLVAAVNLTEDTFNRSVVLLCDHEDKGSFGLVLNHLLPWKLDDVIEAMEKRQVELRRGGPVQPSTLHFIHRCADLDIGSEEVVPGIFWGGDFEALQKHIIAGDVAPSDYRYFLGYSGWGEGQLLDEVKRDSWYLRPATAELVFDSQPANQWRRVLQSMGPSFGLIANFPDQPRLN